MGVILNLAIWFAIHTLFARVEAVPTPTGSVDLPVLASINLPAFLLSLGALIAVFRFKIGVLTVLGACAALGAAYVLFV